MIVCDGFTGNVALKTLEGTIRSLLIALRLGARGDGPGKARRLPDPAGRAEPCARGSTPRRPVAATSSGFAGIVVIAHGSSSRVAIANAIRLAARGVEHDIVGRLRETLPERVVESSRSTNPSGTTRG